MNRVVARHDVLRTAILWEGLPQAVQVVYRHVELVTESLEVAEEGDALQSIKVYLDDAPLSMDLSRPPLLNLRPVRVAGRMRGDDGEPCYAVLMFHHVIADHVVAGCDDAGGGADPRGRRGSTVATDALSGIRGP